MNQTQIYLRRLLCLHGSTTSSHERSSEKLDSLGFQSSLLFNLIFLSSVTHVCCFSTQSAEIKVRYFGLNSWF